ncbi:MAG TPA: hypothetical protein VHZ07_09260 [Bryobacteraceae bacterium]|jgi:hypothetical protein|nr:hypothetical protein [Bryobacteraceae bacterium]
MQTTVQQTSMPRDPVEGNVPSRGWFILALILIAIIAAIPRLSMGASEHIEYDGYWHVFIAQQDNWNNFWREVYDNAHPPLFYLLLKLVIHLGRSLLIYRAISILSGALSVFLVGWIGRKVTGSKAWACEVALAYGLALPGIIISCEVRSYMLSVFFVLLSFSFLLDILSVEGGNQAKARIGFSIGAILAVLSEYFAFFYIVPSLILLFARCLRLKFRRKPASLGLEACTTLPVVGTAYLLYQLHVHDRAGIFGHLRAFYYDSSSKEQLSSYLLRNWENLVNLFLPFKVPNGVAAIGLFTAGLIGVALYVFALRSDGSRSRGALVTILITLAMLAQIAIASVAGKYPFGGYLRQQFILFPFFVLCAGILAGRLTLFLQRDARRLALAAVAIAIGAVSLNRFEEYPKVTQNVFRDQMRRFEEVAPEPATVYLDQVNLITFFLYHDDWQWSFLEGDHPAPGIDVYRLRKGSRQMLVLRDRSKWNAQPDDSAVYSKLAIFLRTRQTAEVSVFSARAIDPLGRFADVAAERRATVTLASQEGICVQRLAVDPDGWYGVFRAANCSQDYSLLLNRQAQASGRSFVRMSDPDEDHQLLGGFYGVESGAWRWTAKMFSVRLRRPDASPNGVTLAFSFVVPDIVIRRLGAITLTAWAKGVTLKSTRYLRPGSYVFICDIPQDAFVGQTIIVDFGLDKSIPPDPNGDLRELGVAASSIGIAAK